MSNYIILPEASLDLDNIYHYLSSSNLAAAERFVNTFQQKWQLVASFHNLGKSYEYLAPSLRGFVIDEYLIFYYPREDGIDVARVVSGYRDIDRLFSEDDE